MSITDEYSVHWKDLGSVLLYHDETYQFNSNVIICDFENCLIRKMTNSQLYHAIVPKSITSYNDLFIKRLKIVSKDSGIVVISNIKSTGKLDIDSIKRKFEAFISEFKIPILGFFSLKSNRLSKPHTGMWTFLNRFYKSVGHSNIFKAILVSDNGGRILEKETKAGTVIRSDKSDMDRAFAANIDIPYYTINEFLTDSKKEKFQWSGTTLSPELRTIYINKISEYKNPNIFVKLYELGLHNAYFIIIYGAPRSGKTTLAKKLLREWRASKYGQNHAIKRFGLDKYTKGKCVTLTKKALSDCISVIVDANTYTNLLREPYETISIQLKIPILYIEVNPGIGMAQIFNHVAVETSQSEDTVLYDENIYHAYKSRVTRPANALLYCPVIEKTKYVMNFRY